MGFGPPSRLPKGIYDVLSYGITVPTHRLKKAFLACAGIATIHAIAPFQSGGLSSVSTLA